MSVGRNTRGRPFRDTKHKYHVILAESVSYKRSVDEESKKNNALSAMLNKLKRERDSLQYSFRIYFDKIAAATDKRFQSLSIIELQERDLERVALVRY